MPSQQRKPPRRSSSRSGSKPGSKPGSRPGSKPGPKASSKPVADPRSLAQHCLEDVLLKNQDVQAALDGRLRQSPLPPRDAGLATELVYGYLRLRARCDFLVSRFLRSPKGTPPALRILLGHSAYALTALTRVPAYATVDWGVSAAKKRFGPKLGGLANAVLRRVAEAAASGQALAPDFYQLKDDSEAAHLARWHSCPQWLVERWLREYGQQQALQWLEAQTAPPPVGLRLNLRNPESSELAARLAKLDGCVATSPPGYALGSTAELPELGELEARGVCSRMSLASLQALQQLGAFGHETGNAGWPAPIWDACCGHGGKSCALKEGGAEALWSSDRSRKRVPGLLREADRLGLPPWPVFLADATAPPFGRGRRPKTILVDAPCSGLGVLSRRPDAKWRRSAEDVEQLAVLQARILDAAASLLPQEGRLCYLTCTITPQENEQQLQRLLGVHGGLELLREWRTPADSELREFFYGFVVARK